MDLWKTQGKKLKPATENHGTNVPPTSAIQAGMQSPIPPVPFPTFPPTGYPPISYPQAGYPPYQNPYSMYPLIRTPNFYTPPNPQPVDQRSSPPSADGMTTAEFCGKYNLRDEVLQGLTVLRFWIGDDHREITPESLLEVKFA